LHALVTYLNTLIEKECEAQGGQQLHQQRRGSSQRQHRQRSKGGASEDAASDSDSEGEGDDERWCNERTWTLGLYELATSGAVPVRRDVTDLRTWRAVVSEIVAAVLRAPHELVAAFDAEASGMASGRAGEGACEGWVDRVVAAGGGVGYLSDTLLSGGVLPTPRGLSLTADSARFANVSLAALAFADTSEGSFFEPAGLADDDKGGSSEAVKLGQIAEAVELLTGAERQALEARADAMVLVSEAQKAVDGATGKESRAWAAKVAERLAGGGGRGAVGGAVSQLNAGSAAPSSGAQPTGTMRHLCALPPHDTDRRLSLSWQRGQGWVWAWERSDGRSADLSSRLLALDAARPLMACTDVAFEVAASGGLWDYLAKAHAVAASPRFLWDALST
jgi:hypothetical protein